jgi:hypothetical protein
MNRREALLVYVLVAVTLLGGLLSRAAEDRKGDWTIHRSDEAGKVEFGLIEHRHGGSSHHESPWPLGVFVGLDLSKAGRQTVKFSITRDAGRFDCEGFVENGEGAGFFHFIADAKYQGELQSLGFGGVNEEKQYEMAMMDVTVNFAKEMKNEKLLGLDTDKLIAFRIFGVDPAFIHELRAAGLPATDCDRLVAFKIHGVTPDMVRFVKQSGYQPEEDTLVAMRIHGVTPEWMKQMQQEGYDHVDMQKLIAFRIHGVSPEFIDKIQGLGYKHPDPDQLVAMRIHGVTPEYITGLRAHGMKDLTIDQLVSLRIQGID